jgi:putative Ca2+/H+ antiporter (TMEM165/GDT1 family)
MMLEAFAVSAGAVAVSEIGDKTQLLALVLAARFRRPWPIVAGILVATLANHAAAAALGAWLQGLLGPATMRWLLGGSFIAVALWMLVPDKVDEDDAAARVRGLGVFGITVIAFFLAEMGDKTQIATVMLAAKYGSLVAVTAGTTLGMMLANVPAVLLGERAVRFVPLAVVHRVAAALFALLGVLVLAGVGT